MVCSAGWRYIHFLLVLTFFFFLRFKIWYLRLTTDSRPHLTAASQAVAFVGVTAGVSHLCACLTSKSCRHVAYPSLDKIMKPHHHLLLIIALLFALFHLALWHQEAGAL